MNIPKKWVAGTVYDPVEKDVIIGATCTLTDTCSGKKQTVKTDGFGDFWFHGLGDNQTYSLNIQKADKLKKFENLNIAKDINLGDIPL